MQTKQWRGSYSPPCFGCGRAIVRDDSFVSHHHLGRNDRTGRWTPVLVRYHGECFRAQSAARAGRQTHRAELRARNRDREVVHGAAGQTVRATPRPEPEPPSYRVSRSGILRPRKSRGRHGKRHKR